MAECRNCGKIIRDGLLVCNECSEVIGYVVSEDDELNDDV